MDSFLCALDLIRLHNAWRCHWCKFVLFVIFVIFATLVIIIIIIVVKRRLLGDSHTHYQHTAGGLLGAAGDCRRTAGGLLVNCWWTAYCLSELHTQILAMTESPQISIHETMHERRRSSTPEPRQMGVSAQGRFYQMRLAQG